MAERVVAPDDRGPVLPRGLDAALERNSVRPFLHDSRADADRLDVFQNVQQHDVSKAFASRTEVVPMFLAIAEQHAGLRQPAQVPLGERVADVIPLIGNSPQEGDKHQLQTIRLRHDAQIAIHLGVRELHEV